MDKLFNSHWFVKVISFFIALMLFTMVNLDNIGSQPGVLPTISSANYTIEEVKLTVKYDEENYAVTNQTQHVKVNLKGPQSDITIFQLSRPSYEVFVDVTGREEGTHTVSVQHHGFPDGLTVSVVPQFAQVDLEEKQTVSLPVQVELENTDEVKEGYTVGTPIVTPVNVDVTAARSLISSVAIAKAYVDVSGADKMIEEAAPVVLYDNKGREIELLVEPKVVDVKVPITSPNRKLPANINKVGELRRGLSIQEIQLDPAEITIFGPTETIERMKVVEVGELNLSEITESGTFEMKVNVPTGIEQVSPETVKVTVVVAEEDSIELTDVPIEIIGLNGEQTVTFAREDAKSMTLIANGAKSLLDKLTITDIQAYIDVSDMAAGDHSVPVMINGPANIRYSSYERTIPITISNELVEGENE